MMTKLGKVFFFLCLGQSVSGKGSFLVNIKGYADEEKNMLVNGKSFAENNVKRILYFNWTTPMIQCLSSSFYSFIVSFEMIVCHFLGVFSVFVKIWRDFMIVFSFCQLITFYIKKHSCQLISWVQGTLWQLLLLLFYFSPLKKEKKGQSVVSRRCI